MDDNRHYGFNPQTEEELKIARATDLPDLPHGEDVKIISVESSSILGHEYCEEELKDRANEEYQRRKSMKENREAAALKMMPSELNASPDINGIFQPKINEEIIEDLFVKLSSYFEPKEQFMNFLTGNQIEGKINFMAKQNKLSGIFIDLKSNEDIVLGTHQQTFDFIKQTFLIEGEQIESRQILRYLKEPTKAKPETFIDISI